MSTTGVFVSYNHRDKPIADAIVQSLTSISEDIEVFIDHAGLEAGDEYEPRLSSNIEKAQWFIIICSGFDRPNKNMNWCFYEAGQFRSKLERDATITSKRNRICYLYDTDRPSQLSRYQGTKVSLLNKSGAPISIDNNDLDSLDIEDTELFALFSIIVTKSADVPIRNMNDPNVRKLLRNGVRVVTRAFINNQEEDMISETVFQPRVSFMLPKASSGLSAETLVKGYENSLGTLFRLAENNATWGLIKQNSKSDISAVEPLWIADIETGCKDLAQGRVPIQTDGVCVGVDGKFYRPVIARYELYRSGAKNCYIAFIPNRSRHFSLGMRSSLLLSAVILTVRSRQRLLPIVEEMKNTALTSKSKMDLISKFQRELVSIETEAVEFGLPPPKDPVDDPPLLNAFREGTIKDNLRVDFKRWSTDREFIFQKISEARSPDKETTPSEASDAIVSRLGNIRDLNGRLIVSLVEELLYWEKVQREEDVAAAAGRSSS